MLYATYVLNGDTVPGAHIYISSTQVMGDKVDATVNNKLIYALLSLSHF